MAFPAAGGHTNLPNGNFSPTIFSQKAQKAFRKTSVVEAITNTDYAGEIASYGDSVEIIKEPDITVNSLQRGTQLSTQALDDAAFTMVVDQANYFQVSVDDIEKKHSHINWMEMATDRAGYEMRDTFDEEVLGYLTGWKLNAGNWVRRDQAGDVNGTKQTAGADNDELLASNKLDITNFGGTDLGVQSEITSIPVAAGGGAGPITSPLAILNRFNRLMDQANVPTENRWFVADPVFWEVLEDEDSKLMDADFGANGQLFTGNKIGVIRGMRAYKSNNVPFIGNGADTNASAGSETNFSMIVAGHMSAVATAQQLTKTEKFRSENYFADILRGMQLYGRKILRSESLFTAAWNLA